MAPGLLATPIIHAWLYLSWRANAAGGRAWTTGFNVVNVFGSPFLGNLVTFELPLKGSVGLTGVWSWLISTTEQITITVKSVVTATGSPITRIRNRVLLISVVLFPATSVVSPAVDAVVDIYKSAATNSFNRSIKLFSLFHVHHQICVTRVFTANGCHERAIGSCRRVGETVMYSVCDRVVLEGLRNDAGCKFRLKVV